MTELTVKEDVIPMGQQVMRDGSPISVGADMSGSDDDAALVIAAPDGQIDFLPIEQLIDEAHWSPRSDVFDALFRHGKSR
jgi:hypothetical protein